MNSRNESNASRRSTADIVILGAGVMGASIAFHLAKRKAGRSSCIDKDHVGPGRQRAFVGAGSHALQLSARSATGADQPAHVSELAGSRGCSPAIFARRVSCASFIPTKPSDSS